MLASLRMALLVGEEQHEIIDVFFDGLLRVWNASDETKETARPRLKCEDVLTHINTMEKYLFNAIGGATQVETLVSVMSVKWGGNWTEERQWDPAVVANIFRLRERSLFNISSYAHSLDSIAMACKLRSEGQFDNVARLMESPISFQHKAADQMLNNIDPRWREAVDKLVHRMHPLPVPIPIPTMHMQGGQVAPMVE